MTQTLLHPEFLTICDPGGLNYSGGSQLWYGDEGRRMSGCAPTAAANIIWYLQKLHTSLRLHNFADKNDRQAFVSLQEEMFTFITPGFGGVHSSEMFSRGITQYANAHGFSLNISTLEITKNTSLGCNPVQVRDFLLCALRADVPVAFLNLSNGSVKALYSWHWVTLVELETETMTAAISDQGRIFRINLGEWLQTSLLGGAFLDTRL